MLVTGLTHNAYHVKDMAESLRFYCDCLGLEKIFELKHDDGSDWLVYLKICDRQFIELFYGGTKTREINWPKGPEAWKALTPEQVDDMRWQIATHICFEVSDIRAAMARVKEFGFRVIMDEAAKGKDNNYESFIQDPDGNLIELMEYTEDALQLKDYSQKA